MLTASDVILFKKLSEEKGIEKDKDNHIDELSVSVLGQRTP